MSQKHSNLVTECAPLPLEVPDQRAGGASTAEFPSRSPWCEVEHQVLHHTFNGRQAKFWGMNGGVGLTNHRESCGKLYNTYPKGAFLTLDYNRFLRCTLPRPFLEDTVGLLFEVYRKAHTATLQDFPSQLVPTRCGMERYFMLERDWPMLAKKHGLAMSFQPNANGGWSHVEIGNTDIVLTQKKVRDPEELVPKAIFRETLAGGNEEQLTLFPTQEPVTLAPLAAERRIFVMLLHGYAEGQRERPSFAHLVVPNHGCTAYLGRLDLLAYCQIRTLEASSETEVITPTSRPIIKKKAVEGNNA